ncbi:MAG TPA: MtrB/PioB family outer membrane beta-barrel protein, partial [Acidobacteriota bacterium]|nr:MtrB/PioB family outer membrane beta-barrel protein [Acidobacteriota bacterium]
FGAYVNGDGTSLGQAQLPADNTANTINITAGTNLGDSRISGMFAYSRWSDSVDLLPFTVNTGITPIPLPANTFNGKMDNITVNLNYLAQIGANGTFTARYRLYDLSNKSDQLFISQYVRLDQNVEDLNEENNLFAYKYHTLDLDLGWKLKHDLVWHVAYGYFRRDLDFREVNKTTTNSFKTSLDWLASEETTVRVSYQYAQRRFDQFADDNPTYAVIPLRRYDIADVNVNTLRGEAEFSAGEKSSISINGSYGKNDYNQSDFGLQAVKEYTVGLDYSYAAGASTSLNLWYEFQNLTSDQKGRQSGAAPSTDPRADWTANLVDKYNTFGAGFSTGILNKKAVWDTDVSYAKADGAANLASPPGGAPDGALSLANANDTDLITVKTSVNWKCSDHTRLIAGYEFEKYLIDDFAEDTIKADLVQYGSILLNAIQPRYLYHVGWIGMIFNW